MQPSLVPSKAPQPISINSKAQMIDEYGELSRQIAEMKPNLARHKVLSDLLQSWYLEHPAGLPAVAEGHHYSLQIGPRENHTTILSIANVRKAIGAVRFLEVCSITLKAIKECLGDGPAFDSLVSIDRTGPRSLKAVAKAKAA